MLCKLVIGNRGAGKSAGLEVELLRVALERRCAVLFLDRPGTSARRLLGHLAARGKESRVVFEEASRTDLVLRWPFLRPSGALGVLDRQRENELEDERFAQAFYAKRGLKDGEQRPYTKKYLDAAIAVWRSQPSLPPLPALLDVFRPGTRQHDALLANAADRDAAAVCADVERRTARNPVQYEIETGAAQRMLSIVRSPVLWARHGGGFDWAAAIQHRQQIYFDLSTVSGEAARALAIFAYTAALTACRRHFERTGEPLPLLVVLEEAGSLDLVTPTLLTAMKEDRKAGSAVWVVSQTLEDFGPGQTVEELLALCDVHYWYRLNAGVERAAQDLADPSFSAKMPHFTRTRMQHDGYETVQTRSRGVSAGQAGEAPRRDERTVTSVRPVYRELTDVFYKNPELHAQECATMLATLGVGSRVVRDLDGVRLEHVTPLGEPWPLGLTPERTRETIGRLRARPMYQPPALPPGDLGRRATAAERLRSHGAASPSAAGTE